MKKIEKIEQKISNDEFIEKYIKNNCNFIIGAFKKCFNSIGKIFKKIEEIKELNISLEETIEKTKRIITDLITVSLDTIQAFN